MTYRPTPDPSADWHICLGCDRLVHPDDLVQDVYGASVCPECADEAEALSMDSYPWEAYDD